VRGEVGSDDLGPPPEHRSGRGRQLPALGCQEPVDGRTERLRIGTRRQCRETRASKPRAAGRPARSVTLARRCGPTCRYAGNGVAWPAVACSSLRARIGRRLAGRLGALAAGPGVRPGRSECGASQVQSVLSGPVVETVAATVAGTIAGTTLRHS
jgi:hypothetical protein